MEKDGESIIEKIFKEEIGIGMDDAISTLNNGGITPEILGDITNKLKNMMIKEVEIRNIPYEYRFLLLNVVFSTMFDVSLEFHKQFIGALKEIEKDNNIEKEMSINTFINKRRQT